MQVCVLEQQEFWSSAFLPLRGGSSRLSCVGTVGWGGAAQAWEDLGLAQPQGLGCHDLLSFSQD